VSDGAQPKEHGQEELEEGAWLRKIWHGLRHSAQSAPLYMSDRNEKKSHFVLAAITLQSFNAALSVP
jgi:hypothetical protein